MSMEDTHEFIELESAIRRETGLRDVALPLPDDYFADDAEFKDTLRWDKETR